VLWWPSQSGPYPGGVEELVSPLVAVDAALEVIAEREPAFRAWAFLDPDRARAEARHAPAGPLRGLTLGAKDIFDTSDQPSQYGSPIYAGYRPRADAAAVAQLRAAGAVVLGKTVTAELAWVTPGPTTNPHRVTHTPGGSSSGSAAAVAAGMVDLALGTQTAGSVIRPASFCGVLAVKPTFGLVSMSGVKPAAPSLDTVGLFGRNLDVLAAALSVLIGDLTTAHVDPRFACVPTDLWDGADPDCHHVIHHAATALDALPRELPPQLIGLADALRYVQAYEGARSLAWERTAHPDLLSDELRAQLDWGDHIDTATYIGVQRRVATARTPEAMDALFGTADLIVTPATVGEAPPGLSSTGDPRFNRLWTLLGCPTLTVPGLVGATGMPIGVQLVARPYHEALLIQGGQILTASLKQQTQPSN
jgi:Asp-tRNA(Asn)/Glu-tRNA(Gln) amidotransferase A subunit family amidase